MFVKGKLYQPSKNNRRNPFIGIPFFIFLVVIAIKGIIEGLSSEKSIKNIVLLSILSVGSIVISKIIYNGLAHCYSVLVTDLSIVGRNAWKIKLGELRYDEIEEIYNRKRTYDVVIIGKNKKKLIINMGLEFSEELFNAIINSSLNCKKIDLENLKKEYPNISVYKRDDGTV